MMILELTALLATCAGGVVELPAGRWSPAETLVIDKPCRVSGTVHTRSHILSTANPVIRITAPVVLENVYVDCGADNQAGIEIGRGTTILQNSIVNHCALGIDSRDGASHHIVNNRIFNFDVGIRISNNRSPDTGDLHVTNNTFNAVGKGYTAILHHSAGGAKILGNKMLGSRWCYRLEAFPATVRTSILLFANNSCDDLTRGGLYVNGPGLYVSLLETGNAFNGPALNAFHVAGNKRLWHGTSVFGGIRDKTITVPLINEPTWRLEE